jgi:pantoate--beta-alanine ligase
MTMNATKIIEKIEEMQRMASQVRKEGKVIAFVPTMGYLHEGHSSLLQEGRRRGDFLVVSIYVNPTQFSPGEDFERYPRDLERDSKIAATAGVDVVFCPSSVAMYPKEYQTYIVLTTLTENLCGASRPGHFRGVSTVCCKLFNIVMPHIAIFGKKDFQQLVVIKRMVRDLNMDIEIIGMPTIRESDGLAMSSRNVYLRDEERKSSLLLSQSLRLARDLYNAGERSSSTILSAINTLLHEDQGLHPEYVEICNTETLKDVSHIDQKTVLAIAVRIGSTRLIDNYVFGEPLSGL